MSGTLISTDIDFDAQGKQSGYLRLPHSVHRSAYGWVPIPITVLRNGDGPTLLVMAGNHGDEYEGQLAVAELARTLQSTDIRGRLILMPMVNFPAAESGLRTSPIDGGNLNRLFPGNPAGNLSEMIAHYIEEILMPLADYSIDLHSGGSSLFYPPTLLRGKGHSSSETASLKSMQDAFDLPFAWVFTSGGGPASTARTAMGAANRKGVINVMAELGGGGAVTPDILHRTKRGLRRVMHSLGLLPDYAPGSNYGTRELHVRGSIYADEPGLFEPMKAIADKVAKGEIVARIHHPETPGKPPEDVVSPYEGIVLCQRAMAQVRRGDALYQIAADAG